MALRTFRSNPSLGGFGGESSAAQLAGRRGGGGGAVDQSLQDCDAFAQIIKELVDNAVDACCMSSHNSMIQGPHGSGHGSQKRRVRVVLERFEPNEDAADGDGSKTNKTESRRQNGNAIGDSSHNRHHEEGGPSDNDNGVSATEEEERDRSNDDADEILRVTVSDNGCGMEDIQECVEAFRSSKAGHHCIRNKPGTETHANGNDRQQAMTAGRYGIGLTLCLLHAQRLVPNSCASITSATPASPHFTKTQYVVDTEGDSVRCVELTWIPKTYPEESGTSISVLVPVSQADSPLCCTI